MRFENNFWGEWPTKDGGHPGFITLSTRLEQHEETNEKLVQFTTKLYEVEKEYTQALLALSSNVTKCTDGNYSASLLNDLQESVYRVAQNRSKNLNEIETINNLKSQAQIRIQTRKLLEEEFREGFGVLMKEYVKVIKNKKNYEAKKLECQNKYQSTVNPSSANFKEIAKKKSKLDKLSATVEELNQIYIESVNANGDNKKMWEGQFTYLLSQFQILEENCVSDTNQNISQFCKALHLSNNAAKTDFENIEKIANSVDLPSFIDNYILHHRTGSPDFKIPVDEEQEQKEKIERFNLKKELPSIYKSKSKEVIAPAASTAACGISIAPDVTLASELSIPVTTTLSTPVQVLKLDHEDKLVSPVTALSRTLSQDSTSFHSPSNDSLASPLTSRSSSFSDDIIDNNFLDKNNPNSSSQDDLKSQIHPKRSNLVRNKSSNGVTDNDRTPTKSTRHRKSVGHLESMKILPSFSSLLSSSSTAPSSPPLSPQTSQCKTENGPSSIKRRSLVVGDDDKSDGPNDLLVSVAVDTSLSGSVRDRVGSFGNTFNKFREIVNKRDTSSNSSTGTEKGQFPVIPGHRRSTDNVSFSSEIPTQRRSAGTGSEANRPFQDFETKRNRARGHSVKLSSTGVINSGFTNRESTPLPVPRVNSGTPASPQLSSRGSKNNLSSSPTTPLSPSSPTVPVSPTPKAPAAISYSGSFDKKGSGKISPSVMTAPPVVPPKASQTSQPSTINSRSLDNQTSEVKPPDPRRDFRRRSTQGATSALYLANAKSAASRSRTGNFSDISENDQNPNYNTSPTNNNTSNTNNNNNNNSYNNNNSNINNNGSSNNNYSFTSPKGSTSSPTSPAVEHRRHSNTSLSYRKQPTPPTGNDVNPAAQSNISPSTSGTGISSGYTNTTATNNNSNNNNNSNINSATGIVNSNSKNSLSGGNSSFIPAATPQSPSNRFAPPIRPPRETGPAGQAQNGQQYVCKYEYDQQGPNELSFRKRDIATLIRKTDNEKWWYMEINGRQGMVSTEYLRL